MDWLRRSRDVAVRQALGASSSHLAANVVRESFFISAVAAAAGYAIAYWLTRLLVYVGPPEMFDVRLDARALAFAAVVALCTTVAAGLVPAIRALRANPSESPRGGRTVARAGRVAERWRR